VHVPEEWVVISNTRPESKPADGREGVWTFGRTPLMSTYLAAICAGPYVGAFDKHNSIELLTTTSNAFVDQCIDLIEANADHAREVVESTDIIATALNKALGYDKVAELVKESRKTGKEIRELVLEKGLLPQAEVDAILDVEWMTKGGFGE
jgi:aspartate ammonia-lyase